MKDCAYQKLRSELDTTDNHTSPIPPRSPIFRDLRSIFEKTVGLVPTLRVTLRPLEDKIACAFMYGSVARREERATSDIDLMVIGSVGLAELTPSLRKA